MFGCVIPSWLGLPTWKTIWIRAKPRAMWPPPKIFWKTIRTCAMTSEPTTTSKPTCPLSKKKKKIFFFFCVLILRNGECCFTVWNLTAVCFCNARDFNCRYSFAISKFINAITVTFQVGIRLLNQIIKIINN